METTINVNLKIWRQRGPKEPGQFVKYRVENVSTGSSFLEMLDMLNQQLVDKGEEPVVFDNDCREGISAMCPPHINRPPSSPCARVSMGRPLVSPLKNRFLNRLSSELLPAPRRVSHRHK